MNTPDKTDPKALEEAVRTFAQKLGESKIAVIAHIEKTPQILGVQETLLFVQRALDVERAGGMTQKNGKKKRTPGGVFFRLVRKEGTPEAKKFLEERSQAWFTRVMELKKKKKTEKRAT